MGKGIIVQRHKWNFQYLVRLAIINQIQHLYHVLLHRQDIFKILLGKKINKFVLRVIIVLKKVYMNLLFVILELINITLVKNNALKLIKVIINLNQGKYHKFHVQKDIIKMKHNKISVFQHCLDIIKIKKVKCLK